jgi:exodeoxyribonuclease-5
MIELTEEQNIAVNDALSVIFEDHGLLFRIGGYAGTGKTTIAQYLVEQKEGAMVCAFTGKAAYRLHQKGLPCAQTIHRTIYHYDRVTEKFYKKQKEDLEGDYFLIDEGSMISAQLWDDLCSFKLPIILLGDPGQLEPVGKDPNLMKDPDIVLEKIHRQAAESGIIQFANNVRKKQHAWFAPSFYDDVEIIKGKPTIEDVLWADIILCGRNNSRHKLNHWIRGLQERKGLLTPGEKIIVLRNNMEHGVFNGQILTVDHAHKIGRAGSILLVYCYDENNGDSVARKIPIFEGAFGKKLDNDKVKNMRDVVIADYGYAITTHKSQGSEWDNVIVIDEQCPIWDPVRWRYTAITRAAKKLKYYTKG